MKNPTIQKLTCAAVLVCFSGASWAVTTGRISVDPEPVWVFDSGSPIYGDSSVSANAVYFANIDGMAYALDKTTGSVLWQYQSGDAVYSDVSLGATGVYFLSEDGYSYKLDAATGELIWRVATPSDVVRNPLLDYNSTWDYNASAPVEKNALVYVGSGNGILYALDAATGQVSWQFETDGTIRTNPAVADDYVIVGTFGGLIHCLDRASGEMIWQYDTRTDLDDTPRDYAINSPVSVFGDTVYVGTRSTYLFALDLATGALKWSYSYSGSWAESPVSFYDNTVYTGSSFLKAQLALDAEDGTLKWMHGRIDGLSYSRLEPTETSLYLGTVAVPGLQYEGFLTDGGLLKLNRETGSADWFYALPTNPRLTEFGIISSPVYDEGTIFFGSLDGNFHALTEITREFPILHFAADRDELKKDEKTTLRWQVIDDHVVRLNGKQVPNEGTRVIRGKNDTLYTLSVEGRLQEEQQIRVDVKPQEEINIAKFGSASASSTEDSAEFSAQSAIDDDLTTRWASAFEDGQSITLDLGSHFDIGRMVINWEGAYAGTYHIDASNDGQNWTTLYQTASSDGGQDAITGLDFEARYLRLTGDARATPYGVSIYEWEVYEREAGSSGNGKGKNQKVVSLLKGLFEWLAKLLG